MTVKFLGPSTFPGTVAELDGQAFADAAAHVHELLQSEKTAADDIQPGDGGSYILVAKTAADGRTIRLANLADWAHITDTPLDDRLAENHRRRHDAPPPRMNRTGHRPLHQGAAGRATLMSTGHDMWANGVQIGALGVVALAAMGRLVALGIREAGRTIRAWRRPDLEHGNAQRTATEADTRTAAELRDTAVHEAAHLLIALHHADHLEVTSATIAKAGALGGHLACNTKGNTRTRQQHIALIDVYVAGREADILISDRPDCLGAMSDLASARGCAFDLRNFGFLRAEDVDRFIASRAAAVRAFLDDRRAEVSALADALVARNTISGEDATAILVNLRTKETQP